VSPAAADCAGVDANAVAPTAEMATVVQPDMIQRLF
jgi:hypothetical protein